MEPEGVGSPDRWLWATTSVLRIKPGFSGRAPVLLTAEPALQPFIVCLLACETGSHYAGLASLELAV